VRFEMSRVETFLPAFASTSVRSINKNQFACSPSPAGSRTNHCTRATEALVNFYALLVFDLADFAAVSILSDFLICVALVLCTVLLCSHGNSNISTTATAAAVARAHSYLLLSSSPSSSVRFLSLAVQVGVVPRVRRVRRRRVVLVPGPEVVLGIHAGGRRIMVDCGIVRVRSLFASRAETGRDSKRTHLSALPWPSNRQTDPTTHS